MIKVRIVLVGVEGEENIGYVARAMSNFGSGDLALVCPKAKMTEITAQRAMRGIEVLKRAKTFGSIESAVKGSELVIGTTGKVSTEKNLLRSPATPKQLAKNLAGRNGTVSILFGRESSGLTNEELGKCHMTVTIPTSHANPALNISNAVAIILYELSSDSMRGKTLPSMEEKGVLYRFFDNLIGRTGVQKTRERVVKKVFRNIAERSTMSRGELYTLAGAFRKILNKLKNK
ncbi:MAG: TrmJ/YjtD family RNA methyltransferase [Candidatus Aenigmarchaeota archaeon]|nr:TrmJ/YjtD family RNA methyltransferase [Candidatus Aenigmarchaeota archaeon]